jgi:hypothetical protein
MAAQTPTRRPESDVAWLWYTQRVRALGSAAQAARRKWHLSPRTPHAPAGYPTQEEGNAVTQHPDTPTSQFTAVRWTFYRRFGLLMRTRLQDDGTTLSLHDVAARTGGRVSVDDLITLVAQGAQAQPDAVTCVLLAQALDVDPDYFVADEPVTAYAAGLRHDYRRAVAKGAALSGLTSLQQQAAAVVAAHQHETAGVAAR